ncbi:MAG: TldD/PmbA family protein, partial [Bdellovibrionales bacterium]
ATSMAMEDRLVNQAYSSTSLGVGVRVIRGDQTGYGYTESFTLDALKHAALTAAAIAKGPARSPQALQAIAGVPNRYPMKIPWAGVNAKDKLDLISSLDKAAFKADSRIVKTNVYLSDENSVILVADSRGRVSTDTQPMTSLGISCTAEMKGRRESNGEGIAARSGFEFYSEDALKHLVQRVVSRTVVLFDSVKAPVGEMPVVLAAGGSGILLHEAIGHGMEADFNRKGMSVFSDKIGKKVAAPFVSIVDDGTLPASRGSLNIDDEGNIADRTVLVDRGTLASYMHDEISAKHYKIKPTGNGRRESFAHFPMPRMRTTYMLPGPHQKEEVIASTKKGIYCEHFTNGQVNIGPGDFTFYVKNGYLIENGKLTQPVTDINLIGNGPQILGKIDMVGNDLEIHSSTWTCGKNGQSVPVSFGIPTVRVSSITVGGQKA